MKFLYTSPIPRQTQPQESTTTGKQLSTLDAVDLSSTVVQATGSQAADVSINGQYLYGAKYATKLARELDELSDSAFTNLPLFATSDGEEVSRPGYYAIEEAVVEPLHPNGHDVWTYDLSLTLEGTPATHHQTVETSKTSVTNDFGSDQQTHIAIPAAATLVEWWDGDAATESPTPIETRTSAFGDLDVFDVDAAPYFSPTLVYRPPGFEAERDLHVRLWDTYDRSSKTDSDGIVQWVRAFATDHELRGSWVLENGLLRLTLSDSSISAERWDSSTSAWTDQSLGTSSWSPVDVDVRSIAPARVQARVLFSDGSSRYPLDMILARGATDALWVRKPNATSATPPGLITLLDPIASTTIYSAGEEQTLAKRKEVSQ